MDGRSITANAKMPVLLGERELSWEDLEELSKRRGVGQQRLKNIRSVHHQVARMIAAGFANVEVCRVTGMSQSYVSILKGDPSFQELLAHYEGREEEHWDEARQQAAMLGMSAMQVLHDRILEEPDRVGTKDLKDVMESGLTFGGQKPAERSENVHLFTTAEELAQVKSGRKENVSIRRDSGRDYSGAEDAEIIEHEEAGGGETLREESAEDDGSGGDADKDPLAGLLG